MRRWVRPLLWAIMAIVLIVLGRLMLSACGLSLFGYSIGFCEPAVTPPIADLAALGLKVRQLENKLATAAAMCVPENGALPIGTLNSTLAPDQPASATPSPVLTAPASPTAAADNLAPSADPASAADPVEPTQSEPSATGQQPAIQPDDAATPQPQANADETNCAVQPRTSGLVLALDRSRSMGLPSDADDASVAELDALISSGDAQAARAAQGRYDDLVTQPGRKRLDDLKDAVVAASHLQVPAGLISFAGCTGGVQDHGSFTPDQRDGFLAAVMGLRTQPATPLAEAVTASIGRAAALGNPNARILLVSDGLDTCGGDPCAAAAASGGIPIDVIAIATGASLSCIAEASGGRILPRSELQSLAQLMTTVLPPNAVPLDCD